MLCRWCRIDRMSGSARFLLLANLSLQAEGLTDIWPYLEPWPWMDTVPTKLDNVPQLLPRQATTGYSESDSGSSSGSNSQTDPSPGGPGLTRKESRKERRLEQNRAA